jgi:hypothetical protein
MCIASTSLMAKAALFTRRSCSSGSDVLQLAYPPLSSITNNFLEFSLLPSRRVKTLFSEVHPTRYCSLSPIFRRSRKDRVQPAPLTEPTPHAHAHRTQLPIQARLGLTAPPTSSNRQIFLIAYLSPTSPFAIHHGSNPFRARSREGTCRPLVTRPPALPRPPAYNYIYNHPVDRQLCACLL